MRFGLKVSGCFGDVLNATPVLKYLSHCHNDKLDIETNRPEIFKNNPYVGIIYNPEEGSLLPQSQVTYDCNGHNFGEVQKQIRNMHLTDYWSTHLGFTLTPEQKTLEFYPDPLDIEIPKGRYIVLNPSITWESRTWEFEKWDELINSILDLGIKVVVDGKDISYGDDKKTFYQIKNENVINTQNKLNVSQLWHLIQNSFAVVTMDSGFLHIAGTTDANIIQLGSAINPYYRSPFRYGSQDYKHRYVGGSCKLFCQSDMKYNVLGDKKITRWNGYRSPDCFENKPNFECHPSPNAVVNQILEIIKDEHRGINR